MYCDKGAIIQGGLVVVSTVKKVVTPIKVE
jgi:hypothetical protein